VIIGVTVANRITREHLTIDRIEPGASNSCAGHDDCWVRRPVPYLHHLLLPFPIVLALVTLASRLAALRGDERWAWLSRTAALAAAGAAALAAASGLLSADHVIEMGGDPAQIARHRNLALGATAFLAIAALLIGASKRRARGVIGAAIAAVAVTVAAHFGGDMLHPGLAPWSDAPHHHGPSPAKSHAPPAPPAVSGEERPPPAPAASSATPQPSAPAHDHSGHEH